MGSQQTTDDFGQLVRRHVPAQEAPELDTSSPRDPRIERARVYIDENLERTIRLEDLALVAGVSRFHFVRLFKEVEGLTPHRYIMRRRTERARVLLFGSSEPLAQIAIRCGFSSQSHMTDAFRRVFKTTPGAMRTFAERASNEGDANEMPRR